MEKNDILYKAIEAQDRERFSWQWEIHSYQVLVHAIWSTIILLLACFAFMSGEDSIISKVSSSIFLIGAWCSFQSSRYHEFMASHKRFASKDPLIPIRTKELKSSYRWAVNLANIREWSVFLGTIICVLDMLLKSITNN